MRDLSIAIGIDLAGYALAVVSGKSGEEFMREQILVPLGMTTSTFNQHEATAKEACASGYSGKRSVPVVNGVVHPLVAAGGLFASANDLARFIIFHLQSGAANGKQILPATLLKEMYAPQFTAKDQISGYGLGIYKALQNDTVRFSHGGLGYGISTHYRFLPEHRIGVVLLTNQDTAHNAPQLAGAPSNCCLRQNLVQCQRTTLSARGTSQSYRLVKKRCGVLKERICFMKEYFFILDMKKVSCFTFSATRN